MPDPGLLVLTLPHSAGARNDDPLVEFLADRLHSWQKKRRELRLVTLEVTRRCNLACRHCYARCGPKRRPRAELSHPAKHPTWHDNMYCYDPDETIRFMEGLEKPWIAFKTMAAGAIRPQVAFPYCFNNGADFVCAGMYDFQIIEDVNIALDAIGNVTGRNRPWRT